MLKNVIIAVAAGTALVPFESLAQYATRVEAYEPGTGYAVEFGTGIPYTDSSTALGAPSSVTPGDFGGPVTPFAAPYQKEQLVSLGEGGSLTVEFSTPIQNNPTNPYGLDFLVFGSTGFVDADYPNGITDSAGSIFSNNLGETRVFVGNDPANMFLLNPSLAPVVDGMFPTDGSGNFQLPVNPALDNAAFGNQPLDAIRELYAGSGGGTGFDLAWAVDGNNQPVSLDSVRFVRVDVLSGRSDIDAFSTVMVPEPSTFVLAAAGLFGLICSRRTRQG
ncbi:PEP-CTERM sorting domain-containing protein [bacterium]|nr:PEP-CTERM sorting domain-containing protein [bacterium]